MISMLRLKSTVVSGALMLFLSIVCVGLSAQSNQDMDLIKEHLNKMAQKSDMILTDVEDFRITDVLERKSLNATTYYIQQMVNGIPVHNAINSVTVKGGKVYATGNAFAKKVDKASSKTKISIEPSRAIHFAGQDVTAQLDHGYRLLANRTNNDLEYNFESTDVYGEKITVSKEYLKTADGSLDLIWRVNMAPKNSADHWAVLLDANTGATGAVINKENYTSYCSFPEHGHFLGVQNKKAIKKQFNKQMASSNMLMGAQYNVVPLPIESPNYGDHVLVTDPHDPTASPFGWHDLDGVEGPETTNLSGNNVVVQVDRNDNNTRDPGSVDPDGGSELHFDFPYDDSLEPEGNTEAAMVNAFYLNNMMHDYAFRYGFDESMNFQSTNYSGEGFGGDQVIANVQTGFDLAERLTNNATFGTPSDGNSGVMRIFVGTNGGGESTRITSPTDIAGGLTVGLAGYGSPINTTAVSGRIVQGFNNTGNPTFGCSTYTNGDEINGNVALVDRGECEFELKSWIAQEAGAVALIICNFDNSVGGLGAGMDFNEGTVTIPSVMIGARDCDRIKMNLDREVEITFQVVDLQTATFRDIAFDNGVLAHEYGHGLSNRATGGSGNSGCLANGEQMGEGWSDYFALVTSVRSGQDGTESRGTGTFGFGQGPEDGGIRNQPYSTDTAINNQTYLDILGEAEVHNIGEIWTDALWDIYWAFVEEYGFDEDFINGNGGNNMAMQLVFDGMFNQQCSPGFVSGRNAILMADEMRYGGANKCIIWRAFAKRGIGYTADEKSTLTTGDNTVDFHPIPECENKILIDKEVTKNIIAGEQIEIIVKISNFKNETSTGIVITDQIPVGATVAQGPSDFPFEVVNNVMSINIGEMDPQSELTLSYTLDTDSERASTIFYVDDMEDLDLLDASWDIEDIDGSSTAFFDLREGDTNSSYSGENYWVVRGEGSESDVSFWHYTGLDVAANATNPYLRFFHRYEDVEQGSDGGFVQVREVGTNAWISLGNDRVIRNKYVGTLTYSTITLPNIDAFFGSSGDEYQDTYIDLSEWSGKKIHLRFRFATNDQNLPVGEWYVDDIQFVNLVNYEGETCVTSAEGEMACVASEDGGTIVSGIISKTINFGDEKFSFDISPNPAVDHLNLEFNSEKNREILLSVYSIAGREIYKQKININRGVNNERWNFGELPSGIYIAKILVDGKEASDKFIVN